jgi:hypothetical protein
VGYDITFEGSFRIAPALSPERRAYLLAFCRTWRRPREVTGLGPTEPVRLAVGLPAGSEGAFYVGGAVHDGTDTGDDDGTVLSFTRGPDDQPGVRCRWRVSRDGDSIVWDGCDKFGNAASWLRYLIATFLGPWGHTVDGSVRWRGEDDATGTLSVANNTVTDVPDEPEPPIDDEVRSWVSVLRAGKLDMRIVAATELACAEHGSAVSKQAAIEALADALDPPDLAVKALETLGGFGDAAASAVVRVMPLLENPSPLVRYWATFALGRMGQEARVALPALERLRQDREDGPRYGAIDAIRRLSG